MEHRHWFGVERPRGFKHEMVFVAFLGQAARDVWVHAPKPSPTCHRFIESAEWIRTALERDGGGGNVYAGSPDEQTEAERLFDCEQAIAHWEETFGTSMPQGADPRPVRV